ncbi:LysR family transcriptional regulator [Bradyrhizobium sp. USDA 4486]
MTAPALDPDLLKAFVAVAEHRSFTRAAATLHRTQSAVSVQIKRLEERLGATLFQRTRAGIVLTTAGAELLVYARRLLELNAEAIDALRARKHAAVVRLGVMDDYGTIVIPPLLARFAKNHPDVRVEIETGLTATMPARLGEAYDLVIAMHPEGYGDGELLRREQAVWAAAGSYPIGARATSEHALRCRSHSTRPAACSGNGLRTRSMPPACLGALPLSAARLRQSKRSRRKALRLRW